MHIIIKGGTLNYNGTDFGEYPIDLSNPGSQMLILVPKDCSLQRARTIPFYSLHIHYKHMKKTSLNGQ